jgi:hypothetical protein
MQSVTSPQRPNHHDDTMSVTSTDVELSATEIAEIHQDIANGLMDLATSQTAATVTSAGSSAINHINQWPKKPTALSGDECLRSVEHACGHQLYELLHQFCPTISSSCRLSRQTSPSLTSLLRSTPRPPAPPLKSGASNPILLLPNQQ